MSAVEGRYAGKRETTRSKICKRKERNKGVGGRGEKERASFIY